MKIWYEDIHTDRISKGNIVRIKANNRNVKRTFHLGKSSGIFSHWFKRCANIIQPDMYYLWIDEEVWYFYGWQGERLSSHEMALVLVDILHSRGLVNDATYKKIVKTQRVCLK